MSMSYTRCFDSALAELQQKAVLKKQLEVKIEELLVHG